jgi:MFS family permease
MGGGLLLGAIAGRYSQRLILATSFVAISAAIALLWFVGGTDLVWLFIPLFGIAAGGILSLHGSLLANLFGLRIYGVVLGGVTGVATTGVVFGPMITGLLFDATGGYAIPFGIGAAMELAGAILILFASHRRRAGAAP